MIPIEPIQWQKDGYILRPATKEDALPYYAQNFCPLDPEVAHLTGSKSHFTQAEVVDFFCRCIDADDRFDFLIIAPDGRIIGESVLNEIDPDLRRANFRIALFHPGDCGKGIGTWAIANTLDFAFTHAHLHRVDLEVFSFNPRAIHTYEKVGFRQEGRLRDASKDGTDYADLLLMAILEDDWKISHPTATM